MQSKRKSENTYMKVFGEIIRSYRTKKKKSMYLVSAESSIAKSSWRDLELGVRSDINLSTFCKIAEGLEIPPYELLRELSEKLGKDFSFTDLIN